jgi:uncharacterized iron-regulated membrane protein
VDRTLRRLVFWLHLLVGLSAGAVILVMAVTGTLLTFEPQLVEVAERRLWSGPPPAAGASRQPLAAVIAAAEARQAGERATTVSLRNDPAASIRVGFGRDGAWFVNAYTAAIVGPGSTTHDVMHLIEDWHRWLGSRELGRPVTGACNLAFLGLALSGLYLWWPRSWSRAAVRAVAVPDVRLRGRARDFNWHNAVGLWCAPVLIVLTLTAVVMSYRWANDLLYRLTGNDPPVVGVGPGPAGSPRPGGRPGAGALPGVDLDALLGRAAGQTPDWVGLTLRLPERAAGSTTAFIQGPATWHPSPRSVLTLESTTARVVRWEPFGEANAGRTLRVLARVLHTGEIGGVAGQLVAGLASAGGAVLVWTGTALAWRRYRAWTARGRRRVSDTRSSDPEIVSTS